MGRMFKTTKTLCLGWLLASLTGPALAQSSVPSLPPAQVAFEKALAKRLPPLPPAVRYQVTQQGLVEFLYLQDKMLAAGALSENGWILQCDAARSMTYDWLDQTQSLTGVYLGAAWLEQVGLICAPTQPTSWSASEVRRLAQASDRASRVLPPAWKSVAPLYRQGPATRYLSGLNRQSSLELRNRPCAQALVADVKANRLTVAQAWGQLRECPIDPARPPLSDGSLSDHYPDAPLVTLVVSPFFGLDQWSSSPMVIAPLLAQPGNYGRLFLDLTGVFPVPPVVNEWETAWLDAYKAAAPGPEREAFSALYTDERKRMLALALALSNKAPTPEECQQLGQAQRQGFEKLQHPNSWGPFLQNWQAVGVVCPDQALTAQELPALQAAWERTWHDVNPAIAQHNPQPLPRNIAVQWWKQQAQDTPGERRECLRAVVVKRLAEGATMSESWMASRALCRPAYQTQFPTPVPAQEPSP